MMEDENVTQHQRPALIAPMINKAKNQFSENGFAYLLWGWNRYKRENLVTVH